MAKLEFYRQQVIPRIATPSSRGIAAAGAQATQTAEALIQAVSTVGEVAKRRSLEIEKAKEDEAAIDAASRAINIKAKWAETSAALEKEAIDKDQLDGFTSRARKAYDDIVSQEVSGAKTNRSRAWLNQRASEYGINVFESSLRWEANSKINRDITKAEQSFESGRLIVSAKPQDYEAVRNDVGLQFAILPADKRERAWAKARSNLALDAALSSMRANPTAIQKELKSDPGKSKFAFINDLDQDDRNRLSTQTEAEIEQIKREQERRRAELRDVLRDDVANQTALMSVGVVPQNPIPRSRFVAAGMGDDYDSYSETFKLAPMMNSLANVNRQSAIAKIESLKPTTEKGAADAVKRYDFALRNYTNIVKQQEDDPGAFLIQNSPSLRSAYEAISSAQTPEAAMSAAQNYGRLAVTEARNIGIQNPAILPKNVADDIVARVYGRSQDDKSLVGSAVILAERQKWGKYWPNVFAQVAKELPGSAAVIGAGMRQKPADRLIELSALSEKDLNALLPSGKAPKDVRDRVNDVMTDVFASFQGQSGDGSMIAMLEDAAYRLAVDYVRAGKSVNDAADLAYSEVVGERYVFAEIEDSMIRVPKQSAMSNSVLRTGLTTAKNAAVKELGFSRLRDAYWQTLPSDDRVALMYDNEPVLDNSGRRGRPGKPVIYTWEELRNIDETLKERERRGEFLTPVARGIK
jgi:hypothetical protein